MTRRELIDAHLPEQAEAAAPATLGQARLRGEGSRHCEERSDEAIQGLGALAPGLLRFALAMTDQTARRRGRCASSPARSRSRPWPKCPTALLCASAGGASCMMSRPSRGRSASPRPGGDTRDTPTRDYFRAEDSEGRRFWLYREGLWGRETMRPKWFVHGLFG